MLASWSSGTGTPDGTAGRAAPAGDVELPRPSSCADVRVGRKCTGTAAAVVAALALALALAAATPAREAAAAAAAAADNGTLSTAAAVAAAAARWDTTAAGFGDMHSSHCSACAAVFTYVHASQVHGAATTTALPPTAPPLREPSAAGDVVLNKGAPWPTSVPNRKLP